MAGNTGSHRAENSGKNNLRLQYHRTFGYFLAVSKTRSNNVPDHWIRRQTLANVERFITPDLKAREGQSFQMKARAAQREYELFCQLREQVGQQAEAIRKAARVIAGLDALGSLAEVAATTGYCPPTISQDRALQVKACRRHPVVEQLLVEQSFIANDVQLGKGTDLVILTGPNTSGKSCYLRLDRSGAIACSDRQLGTCKASEGWHCRSHLHPCWRRRRSGHWPIHLHG